MNPTLLWVAVVTVTALGLSIPNLFNSSSALAPGAFDFDTSGNVVVYAGSQARAAGITTGDRIDYPLMPAGERYGDAPDGLRQAPAGKTVSFIVDHQGRKHVARLAAQADDWGTGWSGIGALFRLTAQKAIFFALVLLASGLLLIRPTRLTTAFFLFVAGNGVVPLMYSFLPNWGYTVVMVADDALAAIGVVGFLALALSIDPKRRVSPRGAIGVAAVIFALIVAPIAISDVLELVAGARPAWPLAGWMSFLAVWFCYGAGCALLLRVVAKAAAPRNLRLLAAVLAAVGALTIIDWTLNAQLSTWYFTNLPGAAMNRGLIDDRSPWLTGWPYNGTPFILRLLGSLLAFYLIIRTGIADAGLAYRRIVAYVIVALLAVAALAFANIALIPHFARYAAILPLEILLAIAIGYWASGLRDLAGCLSLGCVDAWTAWANGRLQEERDALAQSLGLAKRTRRRRIIAEIQAQIAFSSWRNGEDGAFDQKVDALKQVLRGRGMQGIGTFASASTAGNSDVRFQAEDLPEWRARAALVLCAKTNDARRSQQLAIGALADADRAGVPSLQVLASVAVAETCPAQRNEALQRAEAIARDVGWTALSNSILAMRANSRNVGILQPFIDVRLRKSRPAHAMFQVSFFDAQLCVNGARVALSERQLELLLAVASARSGINHNDLIDALWPEAEGDAARNSLRVCLHGLRKHAGDSRIVMRVGKGFILHPHADVDLWRFASLLSACRNGGGPQALEELHQMCETLRAGESGRAMLGEWFFRFEQMLNRKLGEAERLLGFP